MLNSNNQNIAFNGQELLDIFVEIDFMLISLVQMGRNYELYKNHYAYEKDTTRFIDECQITTRLANIRELIANKFDDTLGVDDVDDLERVTHNIKYWQSNFEG